MNSRDLHNDLTRLAEGIDLPDLSHDEVQVTYLILQLIKGGILHDAELSRSRSSDKAILFKYSRLYKAIT